MGFKVTRKPISDLSDNDATQNVAVVRGDGTLVWVFMSAKEYADHVKFNARYDTAGTAVPGVPPLIVKALTEETTDESMTAAPVVPIGAAPSASGRAASTGGRGKDRRNTADRDRTKLVREWAKGAGHEVSDRGRVPDSIVKLYEAAQVAQ